MKYSLVEEKTENGVVYYYFKDENNEFIKGTVSVCCERDPEYKKKQAQEQSIKKLNILVKPSLSIIKTIEL